MTADDGRIRLRLPEGFAAELNVRVDDGSIEIDQPVTVEGKVLEPRAHHALERRRTQIRGADERWLGAHLEVVARRNGCFR